MTEFYDNQWTGCCHVYSYGEDTPQLLVSRADFIKAVQIISYCSVLFGVEIWAFVLMDTHFHFVLKGSPEECRKFGEKVMQLLLLYINRSRRRKLYNPSSVLISTKEIYGSRYLKTVICYVLRNPVDAGYKRDPREYEWSSARLYFSGQHTDWPRISDYKARKLRSLAGRYDYPKHWRMSGEGIIDYEDFVSKEMVESAFGSIKGMLVFMSIKKEDVQKMNYDCEKSSLINLSDAELISVARKLATSLHWSSLENMDEAHKLNLAQKLRGQYGCSKKQVARVIGIPFALAERVLV